MPHSSMPTNGAAIRYHRQMAGWTVRMLAERADLSPGYISKLERDIAAATPPKLKRIADALGLTIRDLTPESYRAPTAALT